MTDRIYERLRLWTLGSYFLVIGVMLLAFAFSFLRLSANVRFNAGLVNLEARHIFLVEKLSLTLFQRENNYRGYLLTGDSKLEEAMLASRKSFDDLTTELKLIAPNPKSAGLVQAVEEQDRIVEQRIDESRRLKKKGVNSAALEGAMRTRDIPAFRSLGDRVRELHDFYQVEFDRAKEISLADGAKVKQTITLITVIGAGVALLLAYFISRSLSAFYERTRRAMVDARAARDLLRAVIDTSTDAIVALSPDDEVFAFNPAAEKLFARLEREILGRKLPGLGLLPSPFDSVTSIRETRQRAESAVVHPDGQTIPVEISHSASSARARSVTALFVRDISQEKKHQEDLRESETLYRLVAKASNDLIWDLDLRRNRVWYSDAIFQLLGIDPRKVSHDLQRWWERVHPEDRNRVSAGFNKSIEEGHEIWQAQYRILHEDGTYREVMDRGFLIKDQRGIPYRMVGSTLDLSGVKRRELELARAVQARDEMVAIISHELKNPLTAMGTGVEILERLLSKSAGNENAKRSLQRLRPSLQRMTRLVADLLDITRLEAHSLRLELGANDVRGICDEVFQLYLDSAQEKGIRLSMDLPKEFPKFWCDRERTFQVFSNLVGNAVKFTPVGGEVRLRATESGAYFLFEVSDTGPGIAPENLDMVFDRFWQAKDVRHRGTGLGLAISKGLVEAQGGSIWVKSDIGKGSTFSFTLPTQACVKGEHPLVA